MKRSYPDSITLCHSNTRNAWFYQTAGHTLERLQDNGIAHAEMIDNKNKKDRQK